MKMKRDAYDLVVVGAGSGGYAAARTARELGAKVALVDKGPLGGLCILRGCMPSKTLLASSDAAYDAVEAKGLGVNASAVQVNAPYIVGRKRALVREWADFRIEGLKTFALYEGPARFLSRTELQVGDDVVLEGKHFVVATGSVIAPPALGGLAETGYLDSDRVLELEEIPASVIILGGGYVSCELGQYLARMGATSTIVIRADHLLSGTDHDIGTCLTDCFREEGIEVITRAKLVHAFKRDGKKVVHVVVDGVDGELEADEIFFALGRVPDIAHLGLEYAGVDAHAVGGVYADETLRTSNENIFAIGDVTGRYMLVHVAIYQGEVAARNAILGTRELANYDLVSTHTIFCDPQVAVVGASERELLRDNIAYVSASYDFAEHGKAMALGKMNGFVKMMASPETGTILGAAVVGPQASELIHEVIVAMNYHATVQDFARIPHLHPTLAEIWTYPAEDCAQKIAGARRIRSGTAG